jgi:hypothetical protein
LTVRFYLAILLEEFDMDDFLRIASDEDAVTMLLILVSQQYRATKRLEAML